MVRIGLVGCGFMGRMHASVYGSLPNAELVAVADRRSDVVQKFAAEFDCKPYGNLESMLGSEAIDVVDVCLPTHLHASATILAAEAGKHVVCEKPMALTLAEADAMTDACRAKGVELMIGHCIRFWPEYALLKRFVDERRLGDLVSINLTRYGEFPFWSSENWLADESLSGGGVLDMHIHDSDFILYLMGDPLEVRSWGNLDDRGPSYVFTTMRFENGCIAHLEGGWNLPSHTPFKMAFRAVFERGALIFDGAPLVIYENGKEPESPQFPRMEAQGGGNISDLGGYYHELKYFVDRLEAGMPMEIVTPESSRRSLALVLEEIRQIKSPTNAVL